MMKKKYTLALLATIILVPSLSAPQGPVRNVLKKLGLTTDEELATESNVIESGVIEVAEKPQPTPKGLSLLYSTDLGLFARKKAIGGKVNKACGVYYKSRGSKLLIRRFVRQHKINVDEAEKPLGEYKTFNDFFIRKLKPGSRTIDMNPNALVSPADSKLTAIQNISLTESFIIKNTAFTLKDFLKSEQLAEEYKDGTLLIFRLAPDDYHRFHFPCDCVPGSPKTVNGVYDSVNPVVYKAGFQPLTSNERQLIKLGTNLFSTIIMAPVGALCIGKIVETYTPKKPYKKGDEAGYFEFGASTIALLFKKNTVTIAPRFTQQTEADKEVQVRVGEAIAFKV